MVNFDKDEIKEIITLENIFDLLDIWGGEPEYTNFGIISRTICHNLPGEGSKKLYYYSNSNLFKCYTGCENDVFDIFELCIKIMELQHNTEWDLNNSVRFIASKIGYLGSEYFEEKKSLDDWSTLERYSRIQEINITEQNVVLKEYDDSILNKMNYTLKIMPWLKEGITQNVIEFAHIGFFAGGDQITIPHYDKDNRFIGLRGRTLCKEEGEKYGKYRPIKINNIQYSHPLGMNLYGLNWSKDNIKKIKKAIIFESEKSVLLYMSYFGIENCIATACCGSSISFYHITSLIQAGAEEIIIALDRQFQDIGDFEFKKLTKHLIKINDKYSKYVNLSFIFDKNKITDYKDAPIDKGKDIFLQLYKERILL